MPRLVSELAITLREYESANLTLKRGILDSLRSETHHLPKEINDQAQAAETHKKMARIATILNYAAALQQPSNQDYFNVLIDFKMPATFEPKFDALNNYFQFNPAKQQMRLKKPFAEIRPAIWELFQRAQEEQLNKINTPKQYTSARNALIKGAVKTANQLHIIDMEIQQINLEEHEYKDAWTQLFARYLEIEENSPKKAHLIRLLKQVQRLKNSGLEDTETPQLTRILNQTCALVDGSLTPAEYETIAKRAQGKGSVGMQVLGGLMIALSIVLSSLVIATTPFITPAILPIMTATLIAYRGTFFGANLCVNGGRKGLSATMGKLGYDVDEERAIEAEDNRLLAAALG